jgi:hypothetical protein
MVAASSSAMVWRRKGAAAAESQAKAREQSDTSSSVEILFESWRGIRQIPKVPFEFWRGTQIAPKNWRGIQRALKIWRDIQLHVTSNLARGEMLPVDLYISYEHQIAQKDTDPLQSESTNDFSISLSEPNLSMRTLRQNTPTSYSVGYTMLIRTESC